MSGTSPSPAPAPPVGLLRDASLFLDFDGTLVEIAERPDAVQVDQRLHELMHRLIAKLDGRVAVISGRPAEQVRELLGEPVMTVVGSHGMEFQWADGRSALAERPASMGTVREAMDVLAATTPGVMVEDKPLGVALHFRRAPAAEAACIALAEKLSGQHGLQLQPGKMMIEVRAGGGDKGEALKTLMREPGMIDTRPVFLGDDHTDEPGFAAAGTLGGAGILVGPARPTSARYRLGGVEAVLDWLEAACEEIA